MHERQFLIGPRSAPLDTWIHHDLDGGFVLSRSPLLRYEGGTLGEMLGGDHRVASGRFVRLGRQVELDAGGTLGVLYRRIGDELWLSSSPELLRTLPPELPAPSSRLGWGTPPETFPPPLTGLQGVYRLMPTQILDLETGELIRRPVLSGTAPSTYESALDELEELLRGAVRSAAERFSQVWVPLTGGSDSRVVLAACHSEGVEVTTYTFDYELSTGPIAPPVAALPDWDRQMPPHVAAAVGYEHRLIALGQLDLQALEDWDNHTCFHSSGGDRMHHAYGQWNAVPPEAVMLGGNGFELGRCRYHTHQPAAPPEWFEWCDSEIDWRDRLYLEQRLGGWLSANEQGVDLTGRVRVQLANSRRIYSILLSLPEELRRDGIHQRDLVRRMAPALSRFPVNQPTKLGARARARLARERSLISYYGGPGRYLERRTARIVRHLTSR